MGATVVGVLWIVFGIFSGVCRADFGIAVTIPNLRESVTNAIGTGLARLLEVNSTITVDIDSDMTGSLDAVVAITNSINSSVSKIYDVTQEAVANRNTNSVMLFSGLFGNITAATLDLVSAATVAHAFQTTVNSETYNAILGNVTIIQEEACGLILVLSEIAIAIDNVQLSTVPVTSENVSEIVKPCIVSHLVRPLRNITAAVDNLANMFSNIIREKSAIIEQVRSLDSSSKVAFQSLSRQASLYSSSISNALQDTIANVNSWASSIAAAVAPINELFATSFSFAPDSDTLRDITSIFLGLQTNVLQNLVNETRISAGALYNVSRDIVYATFTNGSEFVGSCSWKYSSQLIQAPVQVNRLADCLAVETQTVLSFSPMMTPLLEQQQKDLTSITSQQLSTCTTSSGACTAVYVDAFDKLNSQTPMMLDVAQRILRKEAEIMVGRFRTCTEATSADIVDNVQTILTGFENCLTVGQ
ncbi:uncharacterized protein LOC109427590 [Aedes albopictus]|uniref:Uncharacterized protein n=1 Tax=Aedes albopictus TaxID=7160 RepID=A0ABM1YQW2_AEDAL|nr:uncharacterized protein LOC109427590 [Aedes albopictus]